MMETAPGDDMHPFHNRQPVFLTPETARAWLDPRVPNADVLRAPPPATLKADPPDPVGA